MAKRSGPKKRRSSLEVAKDRNAVLRERLEAQQLSAALAYYAAADKGRRNRDWKAPSVSADLAIIPDAPTVIARSRHAIANTWIGKAASRAKVRNIVGRGIEVVPVAKNRDGEELSKLNSAVASRWLKWASDKRLCCVQKRESFWTKQRLAVSEEFAAGEWMVLWSFDLDSGFRLQVMESEQLDLSIQSYGGNEVRGGIEVDADGAAVAYHFYRRNPNDYYGSSLQSVRVPAERVWHDFDHERVMQVRGAPQLAPVLPDVRDFSSFKDATLWRARMEACIGYIVKKNLPTNANGYPTLARAAGDTGLTASGMRTLDMVPGMVPELLPGEDVVPFVPSSPGNQYDPFTTVTLRGIGAGIGMSFGALTRHNDANYSAARQDMLEDEREIGPQQDSLIDSLVMPAFEKWYYFEALTGKLDGIEGFELDEFLQEPERFVDAEYIPPARPWIDPEKEANAYEKAIKLRVITRKEIVASRGGRFANTIAQIRQEREEAKAEGITFPEDAEQKEILATAEAETVKADAAKVTADANASAKEGDAPATEGTATANTASVASTVNTEVQAESSLNGAQITAVLEVLGKLSLGQVVPSVAIELLVAVGIPRDRAAEMVKAQQSAEPPDPTTQAGQLRNRARIRLAQLKAPNYRVSDDAKLSCSTCSNAVGMYCKAHDLNFTPGDTCDDWMAETLSEMSPASRAVQPPPRQEGDPKFETDSARDHV